MQNIVFQKLYCRNFRCHYEFEYEFKNNQLVAFVGPNGSGKTSVLLAILTALYNDPMNGDRITDLVNDKKKKDLLIYLDFKIDDDQYKIEKYYKHSKFHNSLILKCNGKDISEKSTTETHKKIEKILIPKNVFYNTIYFAQQVKDFFTNLTDSEQKKIFNVILGLDEYTTYYNFCDENIRIGENLFNQCSQDIIKIESQIQSNQNHILELKKKENLFYKEKEEKLKELKNNILNSQDKIQNLIKQISDLKKDVQNKNETEINEKITEISSELKILQSRKQQILENDKFQEIKEKETVNLKNELLNIRNDLNKDLEEEKNKINNKVNDIKIQKQKIENELKNINNEIKLRFQNEIKEVQEKIYDCENQLVKLDNSEKQKQLENNFNDLKFKISELESEKEKCIMQFSYKIKELENQKNNLNDEIKEIEKSLQNKQKICSQCGQVIKNDKFILDKKEFLEKEIKKLENKISELTIKKEEKETVYDNQLNENNNKINQLKKALQKLIDEIYKEKEKIENVIRQYKNKLKNIENQKNKQIQDKSKEIQEKIQNLEKQIFKYEQELKNIIQNFKNKFEEIKNNKTSELRKKLIQIQENLNKEKQEEIDQINQEYKKKESELEKLKKQIEQIENIKNGISKIEDNLTEENLQLKYYKDEYNKLKDKDFEDKGYIKKLEQEILSLQNKFSSLKNKQDKIKEEINILNFWKNAFSKSGIPSLLIDESIPFLNMNVREELDRICPGKFTISFDTVSETKSGDMREKFSVNVINNYTGTNRRNSLSGGEKRIIDVCSMRALRALSENIHQKRINISLYDEVLDSLDDENAMMFCENLKRLAENEHIILISHAINRVSICDNILRF